MSRRSYREWLVSFPSVTWLLAFFLVPSAVVLAIAFKPATPFGGIGTGWTVTTLRSLANPTYAGVLWRTVWISLATTAICILLAVPAGYFIARSTPRLRRVLLLMVIVPFWTSFLIRVFAWKVLLHPDGWIHGLFVASGVLRYDTPLLYSSGAILLVMVYTSLPFAILPVYAAAEKFDFRLTEAARDLGASATRAFFRVFLPGIRRGLVTALLVVFIPALGSYVVPDLVGGTGGEMIGNKIAQRTFVDRNLPQAAALSVGLMLAVLVPLLVVLSFQRRRLQGASEGGQSE